MKKHFRIIVFFIFYLATISCLAQEVQISTDRPDQSDGVSTIPKKYYQIESGFIVAKNTLFNELMLRYGVSEITEFRIVADIGKQFNTTGVQPLKLSIKQKIIDQKKMLPAISFIGYASVGKLATKNFKNNKVPVNLILAFENRLLDKLSLGYNIGTTDFDELNLTSCIVYSLSNKVSTFVEYFSTLSTQEEEHNIDAGILIALKPQLQIDFAGGQSFFSNEDRFFATIGISYLFERKD